VLSQLLVKVHPRTGHKGLEGGVRDIALLLL